MALVYILLIALLLYIQKIYKKNLLTVLIGMIILLIISVPSFDNLRYILVTLSQKVISDEYVIKYIFIICLLYFISELLIVLGAQNLIMELISDKSPRRQKLFMHVLSGISTNVDNDYLLANEENRNTYESSAYTNSMLNIISIPFLTTILLVMSVIGQESYINFLIFLVISTNFFALFWFFKRTIDFKNDIELTYDYHEQHLIKKGNYAETQGIVFNNFKFFFIRTVVYFIIASSVGIFYYQLTLFLISFLFLIFIDLFIVAEFFVFKNKHIDEKIIYVSIFNGIKKVFNDVILIIVGMMFVILSSDLLVKYTGFTNSQNMMLFIMSLILAFFITYYTKNYIFGLIFTTPLISLIYSSYLVESFSINILILFVGVLTVAQHMAIIKISFKDEKAIIDLFYHVTSTLIVYLVFIYFSSILIALATLSLLLFVYRYFIIKFFVNKTI